MMALIQEPCSLKIPLQDIILATNNFGEHNFIGKGGFGSVYKGLLTTSSNGPTNPIAVKRLDKKITEKGQRELELEIIVLSSYKHTNLTSLVGFSDEGGEKVLVYKHETNGSLENHLASIDLTWEQRLRICLGAARGLEYLHGGVGTSHKVPHGNIKSSNILLDANWEAKISDFGLSNLGPMNEESVFIHGYEEPQYQTTGILSKESGSLLDENREAMISDFGLSNIGPMNHEFTCCHGNVDPQYQTMGIPSKESDVYSFGIVLFEVLCGRVAVKAEYHDARKFLGEIVSRCEEGKIDKIIMANLREQMKLYSLQIFSDIAYQCLDKDKKQRPLMKSIVQELESSFEYQIGSPTGLWGSSTNGSPWSLLLDNNLKLRKITIDHKDWIFSIGFTVEDSNGSLISSQHDGTVDCSGGELSEVNFDADEEIIGILGTVGETTGDYAGFCEVISSLCIVTNKRRHGPFGQESRTRFTVPWDVGSFAGFYGRTGYFLDGLGFYSKITK